METFGGHERTWTDEEKDIIRKFLKYDHHVPLKIADTVYSAEVESEYFEKAGDVLSVLGSALFYNFPIVRKLPFYYRLGAALVPGYLFYKWGRSTAEELRWGRVYGAYQRFCIYHGQHPKVFI
eukprot:TRINITY_DN0_c2475_g1_i2.p1 TRINITY_DN0_c2475_g1~~TRINITY_DN0_c2475_g1_i2.p1  ORF type:complete len:123 (-),score=29.28 TRINITY_DN0_c2475_g1_i2:114-482(-)